MVLIPVLWSEKSKYENALHIFLPDSMTTWVYLNLDVAVHDFKFWMAHELGHGLAPELTEDRAEDFADAFAGALLFLEALAKDAYAMVAKHEDNAVRMALIKQVAEDNTISPITVYYGIKNFAAEHNLSKIDLGNSIFAAAKNINNDYPNVSKTLFDGNYPDAKQFIERCNEVFDTPFIPTLKEYLLKEGKGYGYIQSIFDIPLLDAKEIYSALV